MQRGDALAYWSVRIDQQSSLPPLQQSVLPSDFLEGICDVACLAPIQAIRVQLPRARRSGKSPNNASLLEFVAKEKAASLVSPRYGVKASGSVHLS